MCISDNIIYCRKCSRSVYIGETGRRLADRFREHRLDVLHKKSDLPVAQHVNSLGHLLEDVRVAVLKLGLARKDVHQCEEMRQIFKFQTLTPRRINRGVLTIYTSHPVGNFRHKHKTIKCEVAEVGITIEYIHIS